MSATARDLGSLDMAAAKKDTDAVTFRMPRDWFARADEIAKRLAPPGVTFGRTDALRAAIARGFEVMERELGIEPPSVAPKKAKRGADR